MEASKQLDRQGILAVLDLHRIKWKYTNGVPQHLYGYCACGWEGTEQLTPLTPGEEDPVRVSIRRECLEHVADVLFEEAAARSGQGEN